MEYIISLIETFKANPLEAITFVLTSVGILTSSGFSIWGLVFFIKRVFKIDTKTIKKFAEDNKDLITSEISKFKSELSERFDATIKTIKDESSKREAEYAKRITNIERELFAFTETVLNSEELHAKRENFKLKFDELNKISRKVVGERMPEVVELTTTDEKENVDKLVENGTKSDSGRKIRLKKKVE